ncbi:cyclase family protein [Geomonas nitrogeniifigens]|uniref:cyclase family protein n=1 Tax=Geomonas diazotrophica TaxID=2843197 RepID=UPI001C2C1471|nr:cyclase family protein [Geomonas nitrogeniifigens]QXE86065.1 cyclase family protein [Geomonas nitrogeniifigens]
MRIHDISVALSPDLPTYPGDPAVSVEPWQRIAKGDEANVSRITLGSHSGTHIDPPRHFNDAGITVDEIPLDLLIGQARVVEIPGAKQIGRTELEPLQLKGVERLLIKTGNSEFWKDKEFRSDFAALTVEGAHYLHHMKVKLVAVDYLSVEPMDGDGEVHRILLNGGIPVIEGVNLADVPPGEYQLICLPLKLKDGDGAPVRALLVDNPDAAAQGTFDPHTSRWPLS